MNTGSKGFLSLPSTRLGWWAAGLSAVVFLAIQLQLNQVVRLPGFLTMLGGFIAVVIGLVAVVRQHERSGLVWLSLLFGLLILGIMLASLVAPQ